MQGLADNKAEEALSGSDAGEYKEKSDEETWWMAKRGGEFRRIVQGEARPDKKIPARRGK